MKIDGIELKRKHIGREVMFAPNNPKSEYRKGCIHSWNNKNGWVRINFKPNREHPQYEALETDPEFLHFVKAVKE